MTKGKMAKLMEKMVETEKVLREAGHKEYTHDEDNSFANFERIAEAVGITREQVLAVFLLKHIDGIMAHIKGHRSQRENISGRIGDARVYLALFQGMVEEDEKAEEGVQIGAIE